MFKPRLYNKDYTKLGFTFSGNEKNPRPLCLVCGDILANESMNEFHDLIQDELWCTKLVYLSDIFEYLNKINTGMQGKAENILRSADKICAMRDKITNWKSKIKEGNLAMFSKNSIDFSLTEEEELAEIKNDQCLLLIYEEENLQNFWLCVSKKHPNLAKNALQILLQFSTTYICEASFSAMLNFETWKLENA
uniref:HAT C-terminal dimerisation domain-containing protein n=1 Tax=Octopus bimaculoides TaxID=37653 RepID=A0A0L8HYE7_OCTBM